MSVNSRATLSGTVVKVEGYLNTTGALVAREIRVRWPEGPLLAVNHAGAIPYFVGSPTIDMVGLDSSIIQHPKTWEASGHTATFADPMVDCSETNQPAQVNGPISRAAMAAWLGTPRRVSASSITSSW